MKKFISAAIAAVLGASSLCLGSIAAKNQNSGLMTVLGDSISTGYNRSGVDHNYGELCGDYLGISVDNYAHNGDKTGDLLNVLKNADVRSSIGQSDHVVISIGGNNVIEALSKKTGEFAIENSLLKEEYAGETSINLLSNEDIDKLDRDKLKALPSEKLISFAYTLEKPVTDKKNGILYTEIIPDTREIITEINSINPDADVIIQTIYQPISFSQEYYNSHFGEGAPYAKYAAVAGLIKNKGKYIMDLYSKNLYELQTEMKLDGIDFKIADVYSDFACFPEEYASTELGSCWYFTDVQEPEERRDFHPNQKGHLAIAALVLEQIGELHDTTKDCLMRQVMDGISDVKDYPEAPLERYKKVVGKLIESTQPTTGSETTEPTTTETTTTEPETTETTTTETETTTTASATTESETTETTTTETETTTTETETTTTASATTKPATTAPAPTSPVEKVLKGDVNGDEKIDAKDASSVLAEYANTATGKDSGYNEKQKEAADVNYDDKVDAKDASKILAYYANVATGGEPGWNV